MYQEAFYDNSEWILPSNSEIDEWARVGLRRAKYSMSRNHVDRGGYKADDRRLSVKIHCLGAVAEGAAGNALGMEFELQCENYTEPDLPGNVEVRMIGDEYWGLRVNPRKDKKIKRVIGVIIPRGQERGVPYRLPGWFLSSDAMTEQFFMKALEKHKGLPDNYVVPQRLLRPNEELREILRREGIQTHADNLLKDYPIDQKLAA